VARPCRGSRAEAGARRAGAVELHILCVDGGEAWVAPSSGWPAPTRPAEMVHGAVAAVGIALPDPRE
jgi:hypothetical protein